MAFYMVAIGVMCGMAAAEADMPYGLFSILTILLVVDFFVRFGVQQTPLMLVKPYMLLPIPRRSVIEIFLLTATFSGYNLMWLCLFIPYIYIIAMSVATIGQALMVLVIGMLMVMANSQWYLLVRTLVGRSLLWWLLPAAVYAAVFLPIIISDNDGFDVIQDTFDTLAPTGVLLVLAIALLVGLIMLNRWMQYRFVYAEIAKEQKSTAAMKHVSQFTFLERFGQTGEYLKLELKSIMRNKAIRSRVMMSLALIVVLSVLIAYTDIYDNRLMLNFWCYYCFGIYGMTTLVKIMGPEGNYIDLLMTHHENILQLLKAKYYFHVAILIVPLLIMMPAVFAGKFSMMMMVAYLFMSSGLLYLIMFQLAVYNKQTLPLDQKLTGKGNVESGLQLILELVGMFLPLVMATVLLALLDEETAYLVMTLAGIVLTVMHPVWLRNIYSRMMTRKYQNLEGFHATR